MPPHWAHAAPWAETLEMRGRRVRRVRGGRLEWVESFIVELGGGGLRADEFEKEKKMGKSKERRERMIY